MITLIIVDCQNDFITGSLSVKGAKEIVNNIKEFISDNKEDIEKIIFTVDWHPYNHSSFKKFGGKWPSHCVQFTPGACIEPKLLKLVHSLEIPHEFSLKGTIEEVEQYGAFSEIELVKDSLFGDRYYFDSIVSANSDSDFIICGIAGDYCVKSTIENLLEEQIIPKVFLNGIASIDEGKIINSFIKDKGLEII